MAYSGTSMKPASTTWAGPMATPGETPRPSKTRSARRRPRRTAPSCLRSVFIELAGDQFDQRGLHARAAAKFVKLVGQFAAEVTVVKGDVSVSGSSIMGLMMLAAGPGTEIEVRASGRDAAAVLAALAELVARKFDET